jgi:hypothetical protein
MALRRQKEQVNSDDIPKPQEASYNIRCLYIDYARQPEGADRGAEIHWRCPVWFPFDPDASVEARTLCDHHQAVQDLDRYQPISVEEKARLMTRGFAVKAMPDATPYEKDEEISEAEAMEILKRKTAQLKAAEAAGYEIGR